MRVCMHGYACLRNEYCGLFFCPLIVFSTKYERNYCENMYPLLSDTFNKVLGVCYEMNIFDLEMRKNTN